MVYQSRYDNVKSEGSSTEVQDFFVLDPTRRKKQNGTVIKSIILTILTYLQSDFYSQHHPDSTATGLVRDSLPL